MARATAVLFGYDPSTGRSTADPFEARDGIDPITRAMLLRDSVEPDHPGWIWAVDGNEEARELRRQALVDAALGVAHGG